MRALTVDVEAAGPAGLQGRCAAEGDRPAPTPRNCSPLLIVERSARLYFVDVAEVDYIEAHGNYVRVHVGDEDYMRRDTLKHLAAELRPMCFEWIHRSTLLNLRRVAFAERYGEGALAFTLTSGARLLSRTRFKLSFSSTLPTGKLRDPIADR